MEIVKKIDNEKVEKKRYYLEYLSTIKRGNFYGNHLTFLPPELDCIIEISDLEIETKSLMHWYDDEGINFSKFCYDDFGVYKISDEAIKNFNLKPLPKDSEVIIFIFESLCYIYLQKEIDLSYQLKELKYFKQKNLFTKGITFEFNQ